MRLHLRSLAPLLVAATLGCAGVPVRPDSVQPPLPARIDLKTGVDALTPDYLFTLRDGRLWMRPNPLSGESGEWRLLGDGLPDKWYWLRRPGALRRISADGTYLVAEGDDGVFYSLRWGTGWVSGWGTMYSVGKGQFVWSRDWDFPLKPFTKPLTQNVAGLRDFSFSSRTKFNVGYYEDGNGHRHWFDFGCDTFFALNEDGTLIHFADPWLPDGFQRKITTPHHGRVRGVALSAAASTLLLLDASGRLHTRMFDFDIAGEDYYFFSYTFADKDSGYLRVRLPLPDWVEHAPVPGRTTRRVTIVTVPGQQGNAARELRVEGVNDAGRTGFWAKGIAEAAWRFVETGAPLGGPLLEPAAAEQGPGEAARYEVAAKGRLGEAEVALESFNTVSWQPARVTVGATQLVLHTYELRIDREKQTASLRGALVASDPAAKSALPSALAQAFGDRSFAEVRLALDSGHVVIRPAKGEAFESKLEAMEAIRFE